MKMKFASHNKELAKFRPSRKIDNKVVCVKCIFHGLGLCVPCEGEVGVKIQRKYLRHASKEETLVIYPDFDTVLLDYDGKLVAPKKRKKEESSSDDSSSDSGSSSSGSSSSSDSDSDSDDDDGKESTKAKAKKQRKN